MTHKIGHASFHWEVVVVRCNYRRNFHLGSSGNNLFVVLTQAQEMLSKSKRRSLALCFLLSIFEIAAIGISRTDGSEYAVKTIKTEYGDIYDCVDFYKQPAFDHPLLKNHSFHPEMTPTSQPRRIQNNNVTWKLNATAIDIISPFKDGGCPKGTVPIRRMDKSEALPPKSSKARIPNASIDYISGTIIAISQTKSSISKVYNGVGAVMSVYKPRVLESQYSSGEIIIRGGTDTLIAGWTVNTNNYQDNQTRFFVYTIAGDMHCFNSECGFVAMRPDMPLDFLLAPVSKRGGEIFVNKFFIFRDAKSGVWWLQLGKRSPRTTIGFWPQKIFTGLQRSATYAACGGEAYTIATIPPPEMGSGYYPGISGNKYDAFCTEFIVVDENNAVVDAGDTEPYATHEFVYGVDDKRMKSGTHDVTFGGPNPS